MIKKLLVAVLAVTAFAAGYGAVTHAWPFFGRNAYYGYFTNTYDAYGTNVLPVIYDSSTNAMPNSINTAAELISFVKDDLNNGTTQEKTGAAFIIDSMNGGNKGKPPDANEIAQWESNVNYASYRGWITWSASYSHAYNSYYQATGSGTNPNDDAFYADSATSTSIVFRDSTGTVQYGIRRQCANPVGTSAFSPLESHDFAMTGSSTVSDATPNPGDTITFTHTVRNNGPDETSPVSITWLAESMPSATVVAGPSGAGTFTNGQQKSFTHVVSIPANAAGGTQYCERVGYTPTNELGAANGRGATVCATVQYQFSLMPSVSVTVNGAAASSAEVGDNVVFTYAVTNSGPGPSSSVGCTIYGLQKVGYYTVPTPADSTSDAGFTQPAHGCPRTFAVGSTTLVSETIDSGSLSGSRLNRTICRSLYVTESTAGGAALGREACVLVGAKPYVRAYGGDVVAGSDFMSAAGTCTNNSNAAIVGWNRRSGTPDYAGAGAQYAVMALNSIQDFSSSQGTAAGVGSPRPSGLVLSNVGTSAGTGFFGGNFGSVPCVPDYYGTPPSTATALSSPVNVSSLASGDYTVNGPVTLNGGGIVNPNNRITIYVNGDVFISSGITYAGSWSVANMPLFRLIVKGNIIIDNDIAALDGLYVAQPNGSVGGIISTCGLASLGTTLLAPSDPTFHAQCDNNKLTVNGSLIARQIQFARTGGTVSQSTNTEAIGTAAESIVYSPIMWIPQPGSTTSTSGTYDSITTLPPVL